MHTLTGRGTQGRIQQARIGRTALCSQQRAPLVSLSLSLSVLSLCSLSLSHTHTHTHNTQGLFLPSLLAQSNQAPLLNAKFLPTSPAAVTQDLAC